MGVGVRVCVGLNVSVTVGVMVGVSVIVAVAVGVLVKVGDGVGVAVGATRPGTLHAERVNATVNTRQESGRNFVFISPLVDYPMIGITILQKSFLHKGEIMVNPVKQTIQSRGMKSTT
jgi:hypothetical protein